MFTSSTRNKLLQRLLLLVSGLTAAAIAMAILFAPDVFYAGYGIVTAGNPALSNELKAPAGLLLTGGVFMLVSTFRKQWITSGLIVAALVYLSYGFSRLVGFALDGIPAGGLYEAALFEIAIGAAALLSLIPMNRRRPNHSLKAESLIAGGPGWPQ